MLNYARTLCLVVFAAVALALPAAAADHWTYDTPVQALPEAAWIKNVVMICESPWADASRTTLTPNSQILKDAGFTILNMYPDGFCRLYAPTAGETWPQECHAEVKAMHAAGMKAMAGCYPTVCSRGPRDLLTAHPEWLIHRADGTVNEDFGCLVSPYGDALVELLVSRIKEYDIDGYQFDGWYQTGYCCCPGCTARYKKETGLDIPKFDQSDPAYLKYLVWRDEKLLQLMEKLRKAVKAVKTDAVLVQWNNNDCAGAYPSSMPEAMNCVSDWTNKEWWDSFDTSNMWLIKRLRGSSGDRPAGVQPYTFMRHSIDIESGVYHGSSCPIEEVLYRMHKVMTLGSIPVIWPANRQGWTPADSLRVAHDFADFLPYVNNTKSLKYAACIDSYTTLQMFARTYKKTELDERILYPRGGITAVLIEEHIPFDVISEHNVTPEKLAEYKVIILPNNVCMSDRMAAALRNYVSKGGSVVATFETSLCDEWGAKRKDFALADMFGASYVSSSETCANRVDFTTQKHPVSDDPAIHNLTGSRGNTTYYGKFVRVKPAQGAIAPLIGLDVSHEKDNALKNWTPLLLSQFGKGRVAYFPAAIDAAYYDAGYPYERMLVGNAIRWAAGGPPEVRVTAPKCVIAGFYTQGQGKTARTVIHLLNDIDTTTGHGSKNDKQFAIREEVLPIDGIKVAFAGKQPTHVYAVPGDIQLIPVKTDIGWEVTVPKLGLHEVVVAQ